MADTKLSALGALTGADVATGDLFYVGDVSVTTSKSITAAQLRLAIIQPGTNCEQNPIAVSTTTTQAHGLSAVPTMWFAYLENLSTEAGYAAGDKVDVTSLNTGAGTNVGWVVSADATNVYVTTDTALPYVVNRTTPAAAVQITAAKWKVVVVPYIFR